MWHFKGCFGAGMIQDSVERGELDGPCVPCAPHDPPVSLPCPPCRGQSRGGPREPKASHSRRPGQLLSGSNPRIFAILGGGIPLAASEPVLACAWQRSKAAQGR